MSYRFFREKLFKEQTGEEPVGEIIQPDHIFDAPAAVFVAPWTDALSCQELAGEKFSGEDAKGINASPYSDRELPDENKQRF